MRKQAGQRRFTSCTANLRDFDSQRAAPIAAGVVIDPAAARVAQDLEPGFVVAIGNNA